MRSPSLRLGRESARPRRSVKVLNASSACVNLNARFECDLRGNWEQTRALMGTTCEAGDPAPDFDLEGSNDKRIALKDFRGKKLALYFYPKDDTSGCTAEAIAFNALKADFAKAGAAILGVSPDSVKSHAKFKAKHALALDLAADEGKAMLAAYGVWVE